MFLFIFFSTLSSFIFSQNEVRGVILDSVTKKPLSDTNIYLKDSNVGTITNSEGYFELFYPLELLNNILVVSKMGYETKEIKIESYLQDSKILLQSKVTTLEEVIVKSNKNTTLEIDKIVELAFENLKSNLSNDAFILKGFFRHIERSENSYKWYIDAAINVYDPGYINNPKNIKVNVIEIKKSIDNREIDTLSAYRWYMEQVKKKSIRKSWVKTSKEKLKNVSGEELEKAINHHDNYFSLTGWKTPFLYSLFSTNINKIRVL